MYVAVLLEWRDIVKQLFHIVKKREALITPPPPI